MTQGIGTLNNKPYQENIRPGFVGDYLTREHVLPGGIKLAAAQFVGADAVKVLVGGAGAARGATSLSVTALLDAVPISTTLEFPARAAVTVTIGVGGAAVDATTVPVTSLPGALPLGTTLPFGGKKFATLTAAAAAGATSLTVAALPTALVAGDTSTYAGASLRTAKLSAAASKGATTLTVAALTEPLIANDTAYYTPPGILKRVAAGTPVGLTNAELEGAAATGIQWGPAADSDDVVRLLAYDTPDVNLNNDANLLRPGTLIRVNFLPHWDTMSSALKTKIRATYECTVGTPGQEVAAT